MRGGDLLVSVFWLYNRTGAQWLLGLAEKVHADSARWDEGVPCQVTAKVGDGAEATIHEETDYPFGEMIRLTIET